MRTVLRTLAVLALLGGAGRAAAAQTAGVPLVPGDRVLLQVAGDTSLSGTFTVKDGPVLELPGIGTVSLKGVPRDQLQPFLGQQLKLYLRNPDVKASVLVQVGVIGEVAKPGFYSLTTDELLSDALMAAGGPTRDARMDAASVKRGTATVRSTSAVRDARARGTTVGQLGLESGDQLIIPKQNDTERTVRILSYLVGIPLSIFALTKIL